MYEHGDDALRYALRGASRLVVGLVACGGLAEQGGSSRDAGSGQKDDGGALSPLDAKQPSAGSDRLAPEGGPSDARSDGAGHRSSCGSSDSGVDADCAIDSGASRTPSQFAPGGTGVMQLVADDSAGTSPGAWSGVRH